MPREIALLTPEHVELRFELAGIGTRFLAVLLDTLLQAMVTVLIGIIAFAFGARQGMLQSLSPWVMGAAYFLLFALWAGYFLYFEAARNGQTPGKQIVGIRVIRDSGHPVDFRAAALRNIVRVVDFIGLYLVGFITMFVSAQYRRLGDYVAGSLVVKVRQYAPPAPVPAVAVPAGFPAPPAAGQFPPEILPYVHTITREEYRTMRLFLDRFGELDPGVAMELARRVAGPMAAKLQLDPALVNNPVAFLEALAAEWERRMMH